MFCLTNFKAHLKTVFFKIRLFLTLFLSGGALTGSAFATALPDHGVILLYHHVSDKTPAITSVIPAHFARQMDYLEQHQFRVWPLPQLIDAIEQNKPVPDKVVAITFDDNYASVYREAFPLLKKRRWPFTVFVSPDAVDKGINMQASWDQLREMARNGATIANHSASHAHLLQRLPGENKNRWRERIEHDIEKAQRRIEEETGQRHKLFAYPYGEFNSELVELVEGELGYLGIGQHSGAYGADHGGLAIPRFPVAGNYSNLDDFALKVHTLPLPVASVDAPDAPLTADDTVDNKKATLKLTLIAGDYVARNLQCFGTGQGALTLRWLDQWRVEVLPNKAFPVGRSRFNCTLFSGMESDGVKRFYWFSHPWIRADKEGKLLD